MRELNEISNLRTEIDNLRCENEKLRDKLKFSNTTETVLVPNHLQEIFLEAEDNVREYFANMERSAENAEIIISGERYLLVRSASMSYEFMDVFREFYSNRSQEEAERIGNNFLFDIGHVLGAKDAEAFHKKVKITDPIQKLATGPVHFAFTGWANVEICEESNPTPDENFFLKFVHHNSFEAQAWIKGNRKSKIPVCTMNCGYSSGWCEESFGISLTTVEIECEAAGGKACTFIMAPPDKIQEYLNNERLSSESKNYDVPLFFERKYNEDKLKESLKQKDILLKEVHHRVKNNLQIISSLLKLQRENIEDSKALIDFDISIARVSTMASVHDLIYGNKNVSSINIEKYFSSLIRSLYTMYGGSNIKINFDLDIQLDEVGFNPDKAIPLGLIINEVACNAFKYAFAEEGTFYLKMRQNGSNYHVSVGDNGSGYEERNSSESLGISLIEILCEQIDAELTIENSKDGLMYQIYFTF